jgi:hypothetical protein
MTTLIMGTLRDPTGEPLSNHNIRVTSKDDLSSTITTDNLGMYSFHLDEGWHHVEVLFKDTYLLAGDIIVNDALPSPSSLEEALSYSTPVIVGSIYDLPNPYDSLQDTLESGAFTRKREERDQLVDVLVHSIDLTESWVSEDELERSIATTNELNTCGASILTINKVYSDDEGNNYSHSTGSVKSKEGEVKHETFVADTINLNEDINLGNYSKEVSTLIESSVSTNTISISKGNVTKTSMLTVTDTTLNQLDVIATELGSYTDNTSMTDTSFTHNVSSLGYEDSLAITGSTITHTISMDKGSVFTSDTYTNDGITSSREVLIDNYVIGREANKLLEVDSTTDTVTVRGILRITDIQDQSGNSLIPEDGNTIFQVFRYGETESGPWEDTLQSYHYWKQENYSVNGTIDPNSWSTAYKFRGEDGEGTTGDTIYYEYQYSPDGVTDWSTELRAGDAFRRERKVVNDVPEEWSDPARIKGENGDEIEIRSQYSVDGINLWHSTYVSGDMYERRARFVNGIQDSAWSDPFKIVGEEGDAGMPGLNGSGWYSIVNGTGIWPGDTQATIDFLNTFGRVPQLDDHLFYVDQDPDPTKTEGKRCVTPVGESPVQWNNPRAYFDGDVIVKGTLSADRLVAQSITGNEIDSQTTIIAGAGSSTAGINGYDLATLPDWMGGGSNPYAGYRFWAGSSTPEFANFTVDSNGKMSAIDASFTGTITMIGSYGLKVESNNPFGPDNLLEWRGDKSGKVNADGTVNLNLLTKVNATTYYSDDNVAYFGGTIIAGTLTLAKSNPSTNTTVEVATGNFGSNGGQIAIACGFSYSFANLYVSGTCPVPAPSPPTVTLSLYEVGAGGSEFLVNSQTFTGSYNCLQEGPEYFENTTIIGSFTHFDSEYSTNDRSYILKATRTGVTPDSQRLSIVTQE